MKAKSRVKVVSSRPAQVMFARSREEGKDNEGDQEKGK